MEAFLASLTQSQTMVAIVTAIGVFFTIIALTRPLVAGDTLKRRMKSVATERERIRARERARLVEGAKDKKGLRHNNKQGNKKIVEDIVNKFNLKEALDDGSMTMKLAQAGYRGPRPMMTFLFARATIPFAFFILSLIYIFSLGLLEEWGLATRLTVCLCIAYLGFVLPNIILKNKIQNRQKSILRAFPDALDLLLICVESGMSVEAAFKRVAREIGAASPPLAEEFALTTAELSFLQKRTQAYDNLAARTGLDGVKAACLALTQAEKVGTPVSSALRIMAQENRDQRMNAAEHKAASLPPKLTVPMIIFFLPVLFIIIITPAAIQVMELEGF